MNGQSQRLLEHFKDNPDTEISAVDLHRIGSGNSNGWCASLSRRLSDLRERGLDIRKTRDEYIDGHIRSTSYTLVTHEGKDERNIE